MDTLLPKVFSVPMRNWNKLAELLKPIAEVSFQRTYEELKLRLVTPPGGIVLVFSVPMRNWNKEALCKQHASCRSFQRTYEELKQPCRAFCRSCLCWFSAYLWELKQFSFPPQFAMAVESFQRTYEVKPHKVQDVTIAAKFSAYLWELKPARTMASPRASLRFQRTYEELKQVILADLKSNMGIVFSVPMRNWNPNPQLARQGRQ